MEETILWLCDPHQNGPQMPIRKHRVARQASPFAGSYLRAAPSLDVESRQIRRSKGKVIKLRNLCKQDFLVL
jgi:hypothetical protein